MKRTDAVKAFLNAHAQPELAALYDHDLELQVNVRPGGKKVTGAYKGRRWTGWTDGVSTWKNFRVPWPNGEYEDRLLTWSLEAHAQAIGLTGWNWKLKASRWVGYDFDALVGHVVGLSDDELQEIVDATRRVPWVTIRRSKSGQGLHLYVSFQEPVPTANRKEHAALARAVLGQLSAQVGLDLQSSVDKLGGNLWVWHADTKPGGFTTLSHGEPLATPPAQWRAHVDVVTGQRARPKLPGVEPALDELVNRTRRVRLGEGHRRLLGWLASQPNLWWWDADRHMLVTHTATLRAAHAQLKLRGIFYTNAAGSSLPDDQNCFAFPAPAGAWTVRRHGVGTLEHPAWTRDAHGWTRCALNAPAELRSASLAHGGTESSKGEFVFTTALKAVAALRDLSAPQLPTLPANLTARPAALTPHKRSGQVVLLVKREVVDPGMPGWLTRTVRGVMRGEVWERLVDVQAEHADPEPPDELVRHVAVDRRDAGFFVHSRGLWLQVPRSNAISVLLASGVPRNQIELLLGQAILNHWELVNYPFQAEYPGDRKWNRDAARLAVSPVEGDHPTWDQVLTHVGAQADHDVAIHPWCRAHGLTTGRDYLLYWLAALLQEPLEPLPYLFLHGPQASGKSVFHEAASLLFTRGYKRADTALMNSGRFNGELMGQVLCVVEETNLRHSRTAYARIKDWVTGRTISIQFKGQTPFDWRNSTHWVQCANEVDHCPILPGDTRITVIYVAPLPEGTMVPKQDLLARLKAEAPAFLFALKALDLPAPHDRLRIPVITTIDKLEQAAASRTALDLFIEDHCYLTPGAAIRVEHLFQAFVKTLRPEERPFWTKRRVTRQMPRAIPRGRLGGTGHFHYGNITLNAEEPEMTPYEAMAGRLVRA